MDAYECIYFEREFPSYIVYNYKNEQLLTYVFLYFLFQHFNLLLRLSNGIRGRGTTTIHHLNNRRFLYPFAFGRINFIDHVS